MDTCPCEIGECVLCDARLLSGLSAAQVCQIQGLLRERTYGPHELLLRQGEASTYLFLIREGQVKLTTSLQDGREQILGLRVGGHLLGIECLGNRTCSYTSETLSEVRVCALKHKHVLAVLEQNPSVALKMIGLLNEELERSHSLIRDLGLKSATEKVATFILSLLPVKGPISNELPLLLSRQEIAELLGVTVETVSRVMAEFKRNGLIKTPRGRILILQFQKLYDLADVSVSVRADRPPLGQRQRLNQNSIIPIRAL